jgi:hypothetical protein
MAGTFIKDVNAHIAQFGVELVRGKGYFYFADITDEPVADKIPSVYTPYLRSMTFRQWYEHVEKAANGELAY